MAPLSVKISFSLAVLAALAVGGSALIPQVAPAAMTMETMGKWFDVDRYQDEGHCDFWVVDMENPTERIEREFSCGFHWDWSEQDGDHAVIHEALLDFEKDEVFTVPKMDRGIMQEWYHVDGHMLTEDALSFRVDGAGVLMPPPGARDALIMGWVESGGERNGEQRLVYPRALAAVGEDEVNGIPVVRWESRFEREPATWHGYDVYLTEEVSFASDPRTAWILEMRRHVIVEMTPAQMAEASGFEPPELAHEAPGVLGEPEPVMELVYETVPAGTEAHVDQTLFFQKLVTPIEEWRGIAAWSAVAFAVFAGLAGIARTWPTPV